MNTSHVKRVGSRVLVKTFSDDSKKISYFKVGHHGIALIKEKSFTKYVGNKHWSQTSEGGYRYFGFHAIHVLDSIVNEFNLNNRTSNYILQVVP